MTEIDTTELRRVADGRALEMIDWLGSVNARLRDRLEQAEAVIAEALEIQPWPNNLTMQDFERDEAQGYNEARDEFRRILSTYGEHTEGKG